MGALLFCGQADRAAGAGAVFAVPPAELDMAVRPGSAVNSFAGIVIVNIAHRGQREGHVANDATEVVSKQKAKLAYSTPATAPLVRGRRSFANAAISACRTRPAAS
jgi:hypothetical protein